MQVAVARHILQELSREDVAVRALGHGDLRQRLPAGRQAFYHELGGLAAQRDHLQVEVTLPEAHLVQGGELHHHLLVDAERPALVVEQQAPEPHLRAEKNRGCQSIPDDAVQNTCWRSFIIRTGCGGEWLPAFICSGEENLSDQAWFHNNRNTHTL